MSFTINPIAFVKNTRKEIEDDNWGSIISEIELVEEFNEEALRGISDFSHLEIIFYFDKVNDEAIQYNARHPRNNTHYPKVGIFVQRGKNRPNKLGLTSVELLKHSGRILTVKGLDAIDGTPIIDIKPIMKEFLPKGEIKQADWSKDLMEKYW
ncbi:tRNA (N6-threonylcarbamoyladenosine(37)-N6)-methyltransferase TrmO [Bacillus sp. AFS055030]|uniref:tRNA (N6-threonylcarbamoyladenosine(37)-N6)-methyltransferase TrmO n=1 Tax=Bacillus sp. AFS055030 TaxID=2033507 RepID=UPI000BFBA242|nr:tRNA (N6-threonylcarbamoyladenosine(37)-N6)-methyltransferase TrmO [Bacillus sp. AFS055030]PGL71177.1 tRNA (N6-threonylcarbamoyladenosine(37)-N6)-methyltransferase TrmO [Bacillus sp. AFS055030]